MGRTRRSPGSGEYQNPDLGEPRPVNGGRARTGSSGAPGTLRPRVGEPRFEDPETIAEPEPELQGVEEFSVVDEMTPAFAVAESGLVRVKTAIESLLIRQAGPMVEGAVFAASAFEGAGNIQGVGYCRSDVHCELEPGAAALVVFTADPSTSDEVKGLCADASGATDEDLDAANLTVVRTGLIDAFPHRFKARPAPCGISVGHFEITAGTIGALARGRSGDRRNRLFVLSNNHVLANVNAGPAGAAILQPGKFDGGMNPRDRIGILDQWVPINFSAGSTNLVDCATAWVVNNLVRREFVRLVNNQQTFFRVGGQTTQPQQDMLVGKSGRTTQLTKGRINAIGVTVNVNYGSGRVGTFRDQFSVVSTTPGQDFSQGGDSGSLIWTWNESRNPVGLLFAGGGGVTFANRIDRVLQALDIQLFT
jgi:hypothetical protein